jgi:L-asparagine transporter-like permease
VLRRGHLRVTQIQVQHRPRLISVLLACASCRCCCIWRRLHAGERLWQHGQLASRCGIWQWWCCCCLHVSVRQLRSQQQLQATRLTVRRLRASSCLSLLLLVPLMVLLKLLLLLALVVLLERLLLLLLLQPLQCLLLQPLLGWWRL